MSNEFTIQEVQAMLISNHSTRAENLRLQSLTTNEFLLNTLAIHHHELIQETAELESMLESHSDFILAVW